MERLTETAAASAERVDELGDAGLERDVFKLLQVQGRENRLELDWSRSEGPVELR